MTNPIIIWFRRDFRLADNHAIQQALNANAPLIPLFIFDNQILKSERVSAPRVKFMLDALQSLDASLSELGTKLVIRQGDPLYILREISEQTQASAIYFNKDYTPFARQRDGKIEANLAVKVVACEDMLIHPPARILKSDSTPYVVYTPFKRQWFQESVTYQPHRPLKSSDFWQGDIASDSLPTLQDLGFEATIEVLPASEMEAQRRFKLFCQHTLINYEASRNYLTPDVFEDEQGTSILSPYLRFGLISVRQLYHTAQTAMSSTTNKLERTSIETWLSELAWRDFYQHILWHFPKVKTQNFREAYDNLRWRNNSEEFERWQNGQTGYPIIDAAMRQLKSQGWMPNRARMIVASFLTKDLLVDWRWGEKHFMQWLIDGDLASNNGGWQWSAGTGTDAQPYFRIFNPISQSQKFDPTGAYIRTWIPELKEVETAKIHAPWELTLPPQNYPAPIVDHRFARQRALDAYKVARDS